MANRSKKVVLSARVDPYLKAGLELLAASQNQKIVKLLETFLQNGLEDASVNSPFHAHADKREKISFMNLFKAIWTEDEVLFKVRAGALGPEYAGETTWREACVATGCDHFKGDVDLYGNLNGYEGKFAYSVPWSYELNIELIREEWPLIEGYVSFVENNKPFEPSYDDYKRMREQSDAK
ncbi:MAG: hypothetical protein ACOH2P_06590 [Pseudomonas sp.]